MTTLSAIATAWIRNVLDQIVALSPIDRICSHEAVETVVSGTAGDEIGAAAGDDQVVLGRALPGH